MQKEKLARPKHPQYSLETTRLSSYSKWPATSPHNPVILCDAGFFYAGFGDCVRCFSCGGGLRNWEDGDTPWIEHARWYPNCEFLKQRKGDLFIEMHRQDRNQEEPFAPTQLTPSSPAERETRQLGLTERSESELLKEGKEIAITSVLEMGYPKSTIDTAIEQLQKQGKSNYSATEIMEIILEQEERKLSTSVSKTNEACSFGDPTDSQNIKQSSTSVASADRLSLITENQALKDQMLCKICRDKDACIVYLPCGHMVTCQDCAPTIRKCCICRKLIQGTVKAYL